MVGGPTVRVAADRAYRPDALIAPHSRPARGSLEIPNPIAVFEVLSPSPGSVRRDLTTKLDGYANVASIQHCVVIDPEDRAVVRFRRHDGRLVLAAELGDGVLRLDPPGLETTVESMLEADV
jgi:Uma2 family endonuclease